MSAFIYNFKMKISDDMDIRIANKYRLGRKIGGGSFGDIYLGKVYWLIIYSQNKNKTISLQRKIF